MPNPTNVVLLGTLLSDPKPRQKKNGGGLLVHLDISFQTSKKYPATYIAGFCFVEGLCELIMEKFHKGDMIQITRAVMTAADNRQPFFSQGIKLLVFDIEDPTSGESVLGDHELQNSDQEDSIPF